MADVTALKPKGEKAHPIPRPFAYPSAYGLATTVTDLVRDYGKMGAINMLIQAAQDVEADVDVLRKTLAHRRIERSRP
jgi:hypothetical protein